MVQAARISSSKKQVDESTNRRLRITPVTAPHPASDARDVIESIAFYRELLELALRHAGTVEVEIADQLDQLVGEFASTCKELLSSDCEEAISQACNLFVRVHREYVRRAGLKLDFATRFIEAVTNLEIAKIQAKRP